MPCNCKFDILILLKRLVRFGITMFRYRGRARTFKQNFTLAAFLSFTAGIVNISGVLALGVLCTNVTGHFAFFAEGVLTDGSFFGAHYLFYIFFFLFGSFTASFSIEYFMVKKSAAPHYPAMLLELLLLTSIGLLGDYLIRLGFNKPYIAYILLFAMGLQNSLVTKVSDAKVRTTHLTGLFTDLGIELSQLFFYKKPDERRRLLHSIELRGSIIAFFFLGCIAGGLIYLKFHLYVLLLAAFTIVIALIYDNLKLTIYRIKRRFKKDEKE